MGKNIEKNNYTLNIIIFSFFIVCLCYIPFFIPFQNIIFYIDVFLSIPLFITFKNYKSLFKINHFYLLMIALSLISTVQTKSFDNISTYFTFLISIISFMFIYFSSERKIKTGFKAIFIIINVVTLISLSCYFLVIFTDIENSNIHTISYSFGNILSGDRLYGILNSSNILGPLAMFSCFLSVYYILGNNKNTKLVILHIILIILNFYVEILTGCRSALVATFITAIALFVFTLPKKRTICLIILVVVLAIVLFLLPQILEFLTEHTNRNWITGSGRTLIYQDAFELIKQKPLLGYGSTYNYLKAAKELNLSHLMNVVGSHNIYIEIALLFGIPALIFFLLAILSIVIKVLKLYILNYNLYALQIIQPFSLMLFILVFGFFEHHGLFRITPPIFLFIIPFFLVEKKLNDAPLYQKQNFKSQ